MTSRATAASVVIGVTAALALVGCGGAQEPSPTSSVQEPGPGSSPGPSSSPDSSPTDPGTAAPAAPAEPVLVPVPPQDDGRPGLAGITEFPLPAGATVDDSLGGAPFNGSWQFSVTGVETDELVAFFQQALPPLGYTVTTDAVIVVGVNEIEFAAGWSGPAYGTVDPFTGLVSVNDRPADGLVLDGTPVG